MDPDNVNSSDDEYYEGYEQDVETIRVLREKLAAVKIEYEMMPNEELRRKMELDAMKEERDRLKKENEMYKMTKSVLQRTNENSKKIAQATADDRGIGSILNLQRNLHHLKKQKMEETLKRLTKTEKDQMESFKISPAVLRNERLKIIHERLRKQLEDKKKEHAIVVQTTERLKLEHQEKRNKLVVKLAEEKAMIDFYNKSIDETSALREKTEKLKAGLALKRDLLKQRKLITGQLEKHPTAAVERDANSLEYMELSFSNERPAKTSSSEKSKLTKIENPRLAIKGKKKVPEKGSNASNIERLATTPSTSPTDAPSKSSDRVMDMSLWVIPAPTNNQQNSLQRKKSPAENICSERPKKMIRFAEAEKQSANIEVNAPIRKQNDGQNNQKSVENVGKLSRAHVDLDRKAFMEERWKQRSKFELNLDTEKNAESVTSDSYEKKQWEKAECGSSIASTKSAQNKKNDIGTAFAPAVLIEKHKTDGRKQQQQRPGAFGSVKKAIDAIGTDKIKTPKPNETNPSKSLIQTSQSSNTKSSKLDENSSATITKPQSVSAVDEQKSRDANKGNQKPPPKAKEPLKENQTDIQKKIPLDQDAEKQTKAKNTTSFPLAGQTIFDNAAKADDSACFFNFAKSLDKSDEVGGLKDGASSGDGALGFFNMDQTSFDNASKDASSREFFNMDQQNEQSFDNASKDGGKGVASGFFDIVQPNKITIDNAWNNQANVDAGARESSKAQSQTDKGAVERDESKSGSVGFGTFNLQNESPDDIFESFKLEDFGSELNF